MHKKPFYIFCLVFFIFCSLFSQAQDSDYYESADTVRSSSAEKEVRLIDSVVTAPLIITRKVPDSALRKLKADDAFWYVNTAPHREKQNDETAKSKSFLFSKWFNTAMWFLIVGCFIAALVWFLASSNIQLFRKKSSSIEQLEQAYLAENIFEIDYPKEIAKAIAEKNFSLAVRLHYLQTLFLLSQKNMIRYAHERTNSAYVDQLYNTAYYKDFFRLTRHFEYTWYGQFGINEDAFGVMQNEFNEFKQRMPS